MAAKKKNTTYYLTISDVKNLDATYLSRLAQGFLQSLKIMLLAGVAIMQYGSAVHEEVQRSECVLISVQLFVTP